MLSLISDRGNTGLKFSALPAILQYQNPMFPMEWIFEMIKLTSIYDIRDFYVQIHKSTLSKTLMHISPRKNNVSLPSHYVMVDMILINMTLLDYY